MAEQGSFHKAAAELDYTQSGISQQIRALEEIVGQELIERPGGSRPVRLTPCGEVLLDHARDILTRVTAAEADLEATSAGSTGPLRVGAFQSIGVDLLPAVMTRLAAERPQLRIELTQTISDPELFELLITGEIDLTFAMLPAPPGPFAVSEIFCDPFVVMVASNSELAHRGDRLSLHELVGLPLVTARNCRSTGDIINQARERGLVPDVAFRSDDNGTVHGLVAAGKAVALVPRLAAETVNGAVTLLELEDAVPPRRVALAWRADRAMSAARDTFVAKTRKTCAELGLVS